MLDGSGWQCAKYGGYISRNARRTFLNCPCNSRVCVCVCGVCVCVCVCVCVKCLSYVISVQLPLNNCSPTLSSKYSENLSFVSAQALDSPHHALDLRL